MADDPLEWLRRLAGQDFTSSLEEDAAKSEVTQFASKLKAAPAEQGYEDRGGAQLSRPDAAFELRKTLSPRAQQLSDVGFGQEAQAHNVETFGAAATAEKSAHKAARFLPVAQAAMDLPKTLTLGYGPSFQGHFGTPSAEQTSGLYQEHVGQAVVQRVQEEHPDWTAEQVTKEAQGRVEAGGQTIGGGMGGAALERVAPGAVHVAGMLAPFGLAAKGAGAVLGLTGLGRAAAEGGKLAQVGFQAARGGIAGAAYAGAKAPEVGEAGDLYSRLLRAAKEAPVMAAGDATAALVRLLPAATIARGIAAVGASKEAAAKLAEYALQTTAGTAQGLAITGATEQGRKELVESPGTAIASAFAAALLPEHVLPRKVRGAGVDQAVSEALQRGVGHLLPPELAAKIPAVRKQLVQEDEARALALHGAIVDETLDWNRKQVVASLNGLEHAPDWIKDEVLAAHAKHSASEGKDFDLASKDFEASVGQVVLAAQHKAAMDTAAAGARAEQATAKALSIFTTPGMQTVLNLPTQVEAVKALHEQATAAGMTKAAAFLEQYARNLAGNPGMATVDESLTAAALAHKEPGAAEMEQQNTREAMADNVESAAAPPPQPPEAAVRTPGALWTPPELEALREQLRDYYRVGDVLKAVPPDSQKAQALAAEHALLKKDLDRAFVSKEGRPLDDVIASTPHDAPEWNSNPALRELGEHLPIVDTGTKTLRRDYVEGESELPEASAILPVNEPAVVRKVTSSARLIAQQQGLSGNAEVADRLQEFAQDALMGASQVFARTTRGEPRNEEWQQRLVDYATASAARETKSFAGRYARYLEVQKQARKYVESIDAEVAGARKQIEESQKVEIAEEDPLGDVKSVLALAAQEGGPLHGDDTGAASMAAALYLKQVALKLAPEGAKRDVGGKGEYALAKDTFIAAHGAGAWKAKTPTERTQIAREMKKVLAPKVAALHDYFRQMVKAREITGGPIRYLTKQQRELLGEDGEGGADAVSYLHAGLSVDPRVAMDYARKVLWSTERESRWEFTREDVARRKPMNWWRQKYEQAFGAGETPVGTSNWAKGADLEEQRKGDRTRILNEIIKGRTDGVLTEEQLHDMGRYLDAYRSINNQTPFDDSAALAKYKETIAAYPEETQAVMLKRAKELRAITNKMHDALSEVGELGFTRGYLPHIPAPADRTREAMLTEQMPDLADQVKEVDALYGRDLEAERGKVRGTSPSTSETLKRTADGDWYDLNPERAILRRAGPVMDYVGRKRFENWWKAASGGTYKAFDHVSAGEELHGTLNQFRGGSVSKDDAIKLGGKFYQLEGRATGKDDHLQLAVIGDPAQKLNLRVAKDEDGKLTWWKAITRKGAPGEHGEEAQFVTEWREVTPQIKQGGWSQIRSADGRVDEKRIAQQQAWFERVMGRRETGLTMKAVNQVYRWLNVRQFGILNQKAAVNNLVAGGATALLELGPKYAGLAAVKMGDKAWRQHLEDANIIRHDPSDLAMLTAGETTGKKAKALATTAMDKSQILMSGADNLLRGHAYTGGYLRAMDFVKQQGVPEEHATELRREGVPEEALAETFARRQGFVAAMRSGALMSAVNTPGLLNNPIGKLFLQYKRPSILIAATTLKMVDHAFRTGNHTPIVRALAVGALMTLLDEMLKTNMGDKFGPRVADLGKDSLGLVLKPMTGVGSPADLMPSLDDPEKGGLANAIGNLRLPLPDPLGAGPAITLGTDAIRTMTAWMKGDDRDQAQQYWEQRNLSDRILDQVVPGKQQLQEWAAAIAPGSVTSRLSPTGNPEAPWALMDERGRMKWQGDRDELWRKAMWGSIADRKTNEGLRERDRVQRKQDETQASRRVAREAWFDAVQELRQTGSPAKRAEAEKQAALYHFDRQDFEREDYLRKALPWARFSGKSQEEIVQAFQRRVDRLSDFGDKPSVVLEMLHLNVRHPENLSGEAAATYGKLIRDLTR